jgi:hypothetical protein
MKICKRCIQPDTRPGIYFDENGICGVCLWEEEKKYDGKCDEKYIKQFCNYIEISLEEFWNVADKFRGTMWEKDTKGNWKNKFTESLN